MNGRKTLRLATGCLMLLASMLMATMAEAAALAPGSYLLYYTSDIDNSTQQYGLYVPKNFNKSVPHPVVFIGHGFNGRAGSSFDAIPRAAADARGYLLVQLDGRGNTFYDGLGEVDFFTVLNMLKAEPEYNIDMTRLYFEGASMGATGAYRQGARHPDILAAVGGADGFCDYRSWVRQYYAPTSNPYYVEPFRVPNLEMDSEVDVAEGAKWQSFYLIGDDADTNVWPDNTINFDQRLYVLGALTPETDYVHTFQPHSGGHTSGYSPFQQALYDYFLNKVNTPTPSHVTIKTKRLKYGKMYWVSIDQIRTRDSEFSTIDAVVSGNQVAVTVTNVLQYTLSLDSRLLGTAQTVAITTNGIASYSGPVGKVTLYAVTDAAGNVTGWTTTNPSVSSLRKTASLEGPIGDAYTSKFLVIYGTIGNSGGTNPDLTEAQTFCTNWNAWMHANITPKADIDVVNQNTDTSNVNLILFGTADTNRFIQAIQAYLPIQVTNSQITLGNNQYVGTNYGAYFVYPNPLSQTHYVVINHKTVPGTQKKDLEALPWYWPDFVIFDASLPAGSCVQASLNYLPATFVNAGYFDRNWQLKAPLSDISIASSLGSTMAVNSQTMLTAVSTGGDTPEYRIRVGLPNGAGQMQWTTIRDWGTISSCPWTPTTAGTYTLGIDAREWGTQRTKEVGGFKVVAPVSSVTLQVSPSNSALSGTTVVMTASTTTGGSVEYKFVGKASTDATWTTLRDWGTERTFSGWHPAAGKYTLMVYARERGSSGDGVASKQVSYTIRKSISKVSLTLTTISPLYLLRIISLNGQPDGGDTIEYQFMQQDSKTKQWTVLRDWNTISTYFLWCSPGNYTFMVNARERNNPLSTVASTPMAYSVTLKR